MPDVKNDRFEFYCSYGVMTEKVNRFGHGFLVFSQIDHQQGENARVEVLDAVGLYSRYMPVLGFKPYTPNGRVKAEQHDYIVDQGGLSHITFKITAEEMGEILTEINQDRQQIGDDKPVPDTMNKAELGDDKPVPEAQLGGKYQPGGPQFNLFNGTNCKRYALKKFEKIGIDTSKLHGFLEIPKNTDGKQPLKIAKGQREGKDIYYWDCPLVVSPRTVQDNEATPIRQFAVLKQGVGKMLSVLNTRKQRLQTQGHEVKEINNAITDLNDVDQELMTESYPNRITSQKIDNWVAKVDKIVTTQTNALKQKGIETNLVKSLLDTCKETFYGIYHALWGGKKATQVAANTHDKRVLNEVAGIQQQMRGLSMRSRG